MKRIVLSIFIALLLSSLPILAQEAADEKDILTFQHNGLKPIPLPDLSELEEGVREQLTEQQETLKTMALSAPREPDLFAPVFGQLAQMYHAYDFTEPAEASYFNARVMAPADLKWTFSIALLYQESGQLEKAAKLFEEALEQQPDDVPTLVHLGEIYFELDRKAKAEIYLERALQKAPDTLAAMARLGEIALSRQQHQRAIDLLSTVLEKVPQANRLHHPLGLAWRGLGDLEKARHHLEQRGKVGIKVDDPYSLEIQSYRTGERLFLLEGRRAFNAGRYEEAVAGFKRAVEAAPNSTRARVNLGSALAQSGRVEEGVSELQKALELEPQNVTAHFNLGQLMVQHQQYEAGYQHLKSAASLSPEDPAIHIELASLLRRASQLDEALSHYTTAVRLNPQSQRARLGEAATLVDLGRLKEAKTQLEAALELLPWDGGLTHALAKLLAASPDLSLRDGERALELAQTVFQAQNSIPHAVTMAEALAELGRCEEAAGVQQQSLDAAIQAQHRDLVPGLEASLDLYKSGPPCRPPGQ